MPTTSTATHLRRALKTAPAASYCGVSASLLRKMRMRGSDDPLDGGPSYIRLSPTLIVYEIAELDKWLDSKRNATSEKGARP